MGPPDRARTAVLCGRLCAKHITSIRAFFRLHLGVVSSGVPMSPAEKMQRLRARQRAGREVLLVECDPVAVAIFLASHGYLPENDDRKAVGEALARALDVWARSLTFPITCARLRGRARLNAHFIDTSDFPRQFMPIPSA